MVYSFNTNLNFGNGYNTTTTVAQKSWEQAASKQMGEVSKTSDSVFSGVLGAAAFEGVFKSYSYIKDAKAATEGIKLGEIAKQAGKDISTNFSTIKTQGAGTWKSFADAKTAWSNAWTKTSANALKDSASKYAESFAKVNEEVSASYASLAQEAAKATTKEGLAEVESKLAQLNIKTSEAGLSSSKFGRLINKTKAGRNVTTKITKSVNKAVTENPISLGKFSKYAKGSGVGIMMVIDGAVELLTNVVPTFQQLGAKSGVKQIFKSGTKVAASAGGWVAGTAAATAIGTAICPGIGTVAGAIIGIAGGMLGSNIASKLVTKIFGKSELEKAASKPQLQAPKAVMNQQIYQQQYPQMYSYNA